MGGSVILFMEKAIVFSQVDSGFPAGDVALVAISITVLLLVLLWDYFRKK